MGDTRPLPPAYERFFLDWVRPRAGAIDRDVSALREAIDEMARRGYLGVKVPQADGGLEFDGPGFRRFQETVARCSGTLAFLESQHQSACSFLVASENRPLRERFLRRMASGEVKAGIAFSQLRKAGDPALRATPRDGGCVLDGRQ